MLLIALAIGAAFPAYAGLDEADPADQLATKRTAHDLGMTGRALPAGCISAPFPTTTSGYSEGGMVNSSFMMHTWRVACRNNPQSSIVLLKIYVERGSPTICDTSMSVSQDGVIYRTLDFKSETGGMLCGVHATGTTKVYALDQYSGVSTFDDQRAFSLRYGSQLSLGVPAYTAPGPKYEVKVGFAPGSRGLIDSSDGTISCRSGTASTCSAQFTAGTSVTLSAVANTGSRFGGWVESGCGSTARITILVTGPITCTVRFDDNAIEPETGFWYDPDRSGMGFGIEKLGSKMMISAYLFRSDGTPFWFIASGTYSFRSFTGKIEQFFGGPAVGQNAGPGLTLIPGGDVTLAFTSSATGTITWDGLPAPIPLKRFVFDTSADRPAVAGDAAPMMRSPMPGMPADALAMATAVARSRVIVTLKPGADTRQRAGALQGRLARLGLGKVEALATPPQFIADVSPIAAEALRQDPDVAAVSSFVTITGVNDRSDMPRAFRRQVKTCVWRRPYRSATAPTELA